MSSSSQAKTSQPWLHGPFLDLTAGCGAWSLPLILVATFVSATHRIELGAFFYFLAVFCNNPHYMATIYRAYGGPTEFNRYKVFSLYLTALIAITGTIAHAIPSLTPWLLTVYLIWSPWHYTGQNFGIAMLMSRRGGIVPSKDARNLLYFSYIASYVIWLLDLLDTAAVGTLTIQIDLPYTIAFPLRMAGYFAFAGGGIAAFVLLAKDATNRKFLVPAILLHLSQFLWFLLPGLINLGSNQENPSAYFSAGVLAFMHCSQYLWITSYFAKKSASENALAQNNWRPIRYFAVLILGGIALFTPGPWLVSTLFGQDLFESALIFTALVNIHHFMLDGAIWKLRDGRVARLLFGNRNAQDHHDAIEKHPGFILWLKGKAFSARVVRWGLGIGLLVFAGADQLQNILTLNGASESQISAAQRLNPNDSRVSLRLAQNRIANGDAPEAIEILQTARDRSPRNLAILHLLARLLLESGQEDAAADCYADIVEITPRDLSALTNLGLIESSKGQWQNAAAYFARAASIAPDRWQTDLLLGSALYQTGDYAEAIDPLQRFLNAIQENPDSSNFSEVMTAGEYLLDCYRKTGDRENAAALEKSLKQLSAF